MPLILATRTHGRPTTDHPNAPPFDRGRFWLTRLFAGEWVPPTVAPITLATADRTPAEHDAVSRALGCRDLFVIDAVDRPARVRVLADLARTAVANGERVLILSPDPGAADHVTEAVASEPSVKVVRALADDENPHRASPTVTRLTSTAIGRSRVEQLKREATLAVKAVEADLARAVSSIRAVDDLRAAAERFVAVELEHSAVASRRDALEAEIRAVAIAPGAFSEQIARIQADHDATRAGLIAERDSALDRRRGQETALTAARNQLVEATAEASKKAGFFSRLLHKPKHPSDPVELNRQVEDLEREIQGLTERVAAIEAEVDAARERFAAEREKLVCNEIAARQAELDARCASLGRERDEVIGKFAQKVKELELSEIACPELHDPGSVARAADHLARRRADLEGRLTAARDRLDELYRSEPELVRQLLGEAHVVVGTPGSLEADPVFATASQHSKSSFNRLVLDRAEELTDSDFAHLSGLAESWVLVGDSSHPETSHPHGKGSGSPHRHHRDREPTFVARVARLLDREPWVVEGERLVCRLLHLKPEQRRALARETVADRPEVELRIAVDDTGAAAVAEIAFPAAVSVAEAKAFCFVQLDETLLRPCGERRWHHGAEHLTVSWPAIEALPGAEAWVELEPGVREKVTGSGPAAFTAAVTFERSKGWDEEKADSWLAHRLSAVHSGRVAALPRPAGVAPHAHRAAPVR